MRTLAMQGKVTEALTLKLLEIWADIIATRASTLMQTLSSASCMLVSRSQMAAGATTELEAELWLVASLRQENWSGGGDRCLGIPRGEQTSA